MPHLESAAVSLLVNSGSRTEEVDQNGISHLLEHMAFKGTKTRSAREIAEEIESVGGELNAATSVENTSYYARVLRDDVPLAVDILTDIIANAQFDDEELAREQHVILQEIGAALDQPEDLVFDHFLETAYPDQAIGRPILGTAERVQAFDAQNLRAFLRAQYRTSSMVLSAAGAVNHGELESELNGRFVNVEHDTPALPVDARYVGGEFRKDLPLMESQIVLGFEGVSHRDENFYTAQVLASLLGGGMSSRLFQEIREKRGLCYSIYAFHWSFTDTGIFGVHAATGEDDIVELMPVLINELRAISTGLDQKEIQKIRAQMRAALLMGLESPMSRASQIGRHYAIFGRVLEMDEIIAKIDAITVDDVAALAKHVFLEGAAPTLSAIGPIKNLMPYDEICDTLRNG
jgi:predicted Zn-dependent peptidase